MYSNGLIPDVFTSGVHLAFQEINEGEWLLDHIKTLLLQDLQEEKEHNSIFKISKMCEDIFAYRNFQLIYYG